MGIKQPPSYVHPNKKKEAKPNEVRELLPIPRKPKPISHNRGTAATKSIAASRSQSSEMALVRLVARPPLSGEVKIYDKMVAGGLSSKQALLGLLKREFPKFRSDMLAGVVDAENAISVEDGKAVETTRSVDIEFIEKARTVFDPFGVLSDRALGQKIGEAVICRVRKDRALS